jgi:hypothetical protein
MPPGPMIRSSTIRHRFLDAATGAVGP